MRFEFAILSVRELHFISPGNFFAGCCGPSATAEIDLEEHERTAPDRCRIRARAWRAPPPENTRTICPRPKFFRL